MKNILEDRILNLKSQRINVLLNRVKQDQKMRAEKNIIFCCNFVRPCFIWCFNILKIN